MPYSHEHRFVHARMIDVDKLDEHLIEKHNTQCLYKTVSDLGDAHQLLHAQPGKTLKEIQDDIRRTLSH